MSLFSQIGRFLGLGGESASDRVSRPQPLRGALIGEGLVMKGDVSGEGDLQILGRFEGQITLTGNVLVGEGAEVDANIFASAIIISGAVRGNLSATTRVEIMPTGVLTGTLKSGSLRAAEGASLKGEVWVERDLGPTPGLGGAGTRSGAAQ